MSESRVRFVYFFMQARGKSPMVSKMEKNISSTMEKAGLVQINIWKVKEGQREYPEIFKQIERTAMTRSTKTDFVSTYV